METKPPVLTPFDEIQLKRAIALAAQARSLGEKPFGAVLTQGERVVHTAHDQRAAHKDPTAHAEMCAISEYCRQTGQIELEGFTLYSSTEPCGMCAGAIRSARISRVVYSVSQPMLRSITGGFLRPRCAEELASNAEARVLGPALPELGMAVLDRFPFDRFRKKDPQWLYWAKRLQAISQNGLLFADNPYHRERYEDVGQIALEIMARGGEADLDQLRGIFARETGYATPKIDVRGVVAKGQSLLFVKESDDGTWSLPGGWCDPGFSPGEAVENEVREESGLRTRAVKLLGIYDQSKHFENPPSPYHIYSMYFLCRYRDGELGGSMETDDAAFFGRDRVPRLSPERVTPGLVARMYEHLDHPEWPADFD